MNIIQKNISFNSFLKRNYINFFLGLVFSFSQINVFAQVEIKADTTKIRIGEQIKYEISVNSTQNVVFSKFKTDSLQKIEVVKEFSVETLKDKLVKKYLLTSFDSGAYYIPRQDININGTHYFTDSLLINVGTVAVDTTKQGLFPIKPIYKAPPKTWHEYLYLLWWILGALLLVGLIWWLAFRSKKVLQWKPKVILTPYDEALNQLKSLDDKNLIQNQKIKEYYTELTDIVRVYMEKDLKISAMELTSDELITLFKKTNKYKKLGISRNQLENLQIFLQNADLVKFAKAVPENHEIKEDRNHAEELLKEIKTVVSRPQLDENGQPIVEMVQEEVLIKTSKKRRMIGVGIGIGILILLMAGSVWYYGFQYVKDTFVGHPSKELLEGKWYKANYGYPAIYAETPVVLKPTQIELPPQVKEFYTSMSIFEYGSLISGFSIYLGSSEYNLEKQFNMDGAIEGAINNMKIQKGVSNLQYQTEDSSIDGLDAKKINGTLKYGNQNMIFTAYFIENANSFRQILITRKPTDTYAAQMEKRILSSIKLERMQSDQE